MKRLIFSVSVLSLWGSLSFAPAAGAQTDFPVPGSIPFQIIPSGKPGAAASPLIKPQSRTKKRDSISAVIKTAAPSVPAPQAKPRTADERSETRRRNIADEREQEADGEQEQKQDIIKRQILQSPAPQAKPRTADERGFTPARLGADKKAADERSETKRADKASADSTADSEIMAPALTIPIPVPIPAPLPETVPLLPPASADRAEPQAAPYQAASGTPLTYPQNPQSNRSFPRFGDRKPHIWVSRRKPWHYAVHGTDISRHNGGIDWTKMARSGVSFVFIKATEGGDHTDPNFKQNWRAARAVGLARGAYHFYYFCRPVRDQLRWFIKNVPREKNSMPPVLDMEWNHTSPSCRRRPSPEQVQKDMRIFLQGVEKHYGKRPIIYTSVDFFRDNDLHVLKNYPFWLRSVAAHPDERYKNHPWLFWQYTGTGRIPGMSGDADINVFVGNAKQWRSWLQISGR